MRHSNVEEVSFHHLTKRSLFRVGYYGFLGISLPFAMTIFLIGMAGLLFSDDRLASFGLVIASLIYAFAGPAMVGGLLVFGGPFARILTRRFGWGALEFYDDSDA